VDALQAGDSRPQHKAQAMIAHVVLFTPSAGMSPRDREAFLELLRAAFAGIPGIERVRVGKRTRLGRPYDGLMTIPIEYAAVLEFETVDALHGYLDHPGHAELGRRFFEVAGTALVYDFAMVEPERVGELVDD
jgi:hypothetical protein